MPQESKHCAVLRTAFSPKLSNLWAKQLSKHVMANKWYQVTAASIPPNTQSNAWKEKRILRNHYINLFKTSSTWSVQSPVEEGLHRIDSISWANHCPIWILLTNCQLLWGKLREPWMVSFQQKNQLYVFVVLLNIVWSSIYQSRSHEWVSSVFIIKPPVSMWIKLKTLAFLSCFSFPSEKRHSTWSHFCDAEKFLCAASNIQSFRLFVSLGILWNWRRITRSQIWDKTTYDQRSGPQIWS